MKVILNESQVLNILNEITSEQRMDFLLDKVSKEGINSLTPAEKIELRRLSGEDVDSDEEETSNDFDNEYTNEDLEFSDVIELISDSFPNGITFRIDNTTWNAFIENEPSGLENNELKISVTDGERLIDIFPFKDGESKLRVLSTERRPFGVNLKGIPTNMDETGYFIRTLINVDIPKIISYVLKTS